MTQPLTRAVRYLRVSSSAQSESDRFGLDRQRRAAMRCEQRHRLEAVSEVVDIISGASESRTGLDSLPAVAEQHRAYAVSLPEVDRLSRADFMTAYNILRTIINTGLDIYANDLKGRINHRDPESVREVNERLKDSYEERHRIRERTYGGLVEKLLSGKPIRPPNNYGYRHGEPYPPEAAWVERMYELTRSYGNQRLALTLNEEGGRTASGKLWTAASVATILTNPVYMGRYEWGNQAVCTNPACGDTHTATWRRARLGTASCPRCGAAVRLLRYEVPVEAIVSPEVWEAAQAARLARKEVSGKTTRYPIRFPLTGTIVCYKCGHAMTGVPSGKYRHYTCNASRRKPVVSGARERCTHNRFYRAAELHDAVEAILRSLLDNPDMLREYLSGDDAPARAEAARAEAVKQDAMAKLARIEEGWLAGVLSTETAMQRRKEQELRLATLPRSVPRRLVPDVKEIGSRLRVMLETATLGDVLRMLNAKIIVSETALELTVR